MLVCPRVKAVNISFKTCFYLGVLENKKERAESNFSLAIIYFSFQGGVGRKPQFSAGNYFLWEMYLRKVLKVNILLNKV